MLIYFLFWNAIRKLKRLFNRTPFKIGFWGLTFAIGSDAGGDVGGFQQCFLVVQVLAHFSVLLIHLYVAAWHTHKRTFREGSNTKIMTVPKQQ